MGTSLVAVQASCPLCGSPVLSIGRGGRVMTADLHPVLVALDRDRGYSLCDSCGVLADIPTDLTLN
jgi:hypothetical protein